MFVIIEYIDLSFIRKIEVDSNFDEACECRMNLVPDIQKQRNSP